MSRRNSDPDELIDRLRAVSDELKSLKALAADNAELWGLAGNLDMAESYVDASLNSMR